MVVHPFQAEALPELIEWCAFGIIPGMIAVPRVLVQSHFSLSLSPRAWIVGIQMDKDKCSPIQSVPKTQ